MKWWGYLVCGILIVFALFSTTQLIEMFGVKNATYGTPTTIEEQQGLVRL